MIETTVIQARNAYSALQNIFAENKLPLKAGWRVARLMGKLKSIAADAETLQMKMVRDAGGVQSQNAQGQTSVNLPAPERTPEQTDEQYRAALVSYREMVEEVADKIKAMGEESIGIDYDPIPMTLFGEDERFSPNDLAALEQFIQEE